MTCSSTSSYNLVNKAEAIKVSTAEIELRGLPYKKLADDYKKLTSYDLQLITPSDSNMTQFVGIYLANPSYTSLSDEQGMYLYKKPEKFIFFYFGSQNQRPYSIKLSMFPSTCSTAILYDLFFPTLYSKMFLDFVSSMASKLKFSNIIFTQVHDEIADYIKDTGFELVSLTYNIRSNRKVGLYNKNL